MKKLLTLLFLPLAFITNAMAQDLPGWTQDPVIKETHWFGVYEYEEYPNEDYDSKTITFDGNYLQSIEIVKTHTGQTPKQVPKTTFFSWLDHKYRFSVENTGAWGLIQEINNQWKIQEGAWPNDGRDHYEWDGMGLCNITDHYSKLNILNLKAGDQFSIEYYLDRLDGTDYDYNWMTHMAFDSGATNLNPGDEIVSKQNYDVTADGDVCINVPKHAIIRNIVIRLKEYQVADFDVRELTQAEINEYDPQHHFGQIGYRYFFKNPGVLEDKRGAAPYITMKFGADNDMTFVRALGDVTVEYGDLAETEAVLYGKETYDQNPTVITPDNDNVFTIHSGVSANPNGAQDWDSQFWIAAPYALSEGQTFKVDFWYKADQEATASTQAHTSPGNYLHWACIGDLSFTSEWKHFEGTATTVTNQMNGMQSIAFNLNVFKEDNTYYIKDIKLSVPERTESYSTNSLAAASIVDATNEFDPDKVHFQYHDFYGVSNDLSSKFSADKNKSRLAGKEWSVFTADHDYNVDASQPYQAGADGDVVFGDKFNTIWPKYGTFFYFFPEVDGLLHIEFYCEGSEETPAFWYKQRADGTYPQVEDQPAKTLHNLNGGGRTQGLNHYSFEVEVERGGVYYLCSLPTDMVHERPIVRLESYAFIPKFMVKPLYKVVKNTEVENGNEAIQRVAEIFGGPYDDLNGGQLAGQGHGYGDYNYELTGTYTRNAESELRVKCLGNVVSAKAFSEYYQGKQYLTFSDIKFREGSNEAGEAFNPGGAVVVHVNNDVGQASFVLTVAYDAADAKWGERDGKDTRIAATSNGEEVKHWDFYSGKGDYIEGNVINSGWNLGKYGEDDGTRYADNPDGWKAKSKLFKEIHKADGLTADWEFDYVDVQNRKEQIYKSVYDMEADNADMIHETAGLVFFTDPNELGVFNENDAPTSSFQDRFIGLMGGGKLIIPRLKADDRVVIKMGCFGNVEGTGDSEMEQKAVLWLKNAKDAMGNAIPEETDYIIGGSEPFAEPAKALMWPHGEYHFVVANTSNSDAEDFTIQLKEGALLKIYSIDIYRNAANNNADILTENVVTGLEPEMLFTDQDTEAKDAVCYLRYSGWQEKSEFHGNGFDQIRGNLGSLSASDFQGEEFTTQPYWKYTQASAFELGDFGSFRAKMAVKTKDDANTFVTDYAPGCMAVDYLKTMPYPYTWDFTDLVSLGGAADAIADEQGRTDLIADYNGWKVVDGENVATGLRNAPETEPGVLFANGGQIYADDLMLAEAAGIGLKRSIEDPDDAEQLNNSVNITADGLVLNSTTEGVFHKLVLPKVTKAAVYVRATPIEGATVKAEYSTDGESGTGLKAFSVAGSNDKIYVMENAIGDNDDPRNVELWLNGMTVKKIGVSEDPKALNKYGWATESRMRIIDPELTAYMTGQPIATYIVTGTSVSDKKVVLTPVDGSSFVLDQATDDGQPQAYILRNTAETKNVDILNGGFHLFVPDMHDYDLYNLNSDNLKLLQDVTGNLMISKLVSGKLEMYDGEYTNYILTFQTNKAGWETTDENRLDEDSDFGTVGFFRVQPSGVTSKGNQGYMQFLTTDVKPGSNGINGFTFVFDEDGIYSISNTGINDAEPVYYNLQGQQLNGIPTQRGIYIVRGKKITVK